MSLLEFFFENPLFIFILLGILSSLFSKGNDEKKQKRRPSPQPKPFVESKPLPKIEPIQKPATLSKTWEEEKKPEMNWKKSKIQEQYLQKLEEKLEVIPSVAKKVENEEVAPKGKIDVDQITEEKLVDAVIWSEILGPPRAKKAHRFMNYR